MPLFGLRAFFVGKGTYHTVPEQGPSYCVAHYFQEESLSAMCRFCTVNVGCGPWKDDPIGGWRLDNQCSEHKITHDVYLEYALRDKWVRACGLSDQMLGKGSPVGLATELSSARGLHRAGLGVVGWAVIDKVHHFDAFDDISA